MFLFVLCVSVLLWFNSPVFAGKVNLCASRHD